MNEADQAANLAALRVKAHDIFDALWKDGMMSRTQAYNWLARHMKLAPQDCHISDFDEQQCGKVISLARAKRRMMAFDTNPKRTQHTGSTAGDEDSDDRLLLDNLD